MSSKILFPLVLLFSLACSREETTQKTLELLHVFVGDAEIDRTGNVSEGLPIDRSITLVFSLPVSESSARAGIQLTTGSQVVDTQMTFLSSGHTVVLYPAGPLENNALYTIDLTAILRGAEGGMFAPVEINFRTEQGPLTLTSVAIADADVTASDPVTDVPLDLSMTLHFSTPVDIATFQDAVTLTGPNAPELNFAWTDGNRTVDLTTDPLAHLSRYRFTISQSLKGAAGEPFSNYSKTLFTIVDKNPKFPVVSDDELLTLVQKQTFKYFWDLAHQASGMARERNSSGDVVTTGGSGFGIMALIVGMQRNFISRAQGLERMDKILTFLETADRFHGAWPHWLNGNTGDVVPFSANDDGGDLVETSYLIQGLLTFRQYLDPAIAVEKSLIDRINALWDTVEWDWYTRGGQDVLYWHWSPDKEWIMNHPVRGYNEALITYFLAAASRAHTIQASVYHNGWAGGGTIINNKSFYGIILPLGPDYGGPLFFAHYSFLGLDPRTLNDRYARYWTQNVNHTLINHAHAVANPHHFVGYSDENWGFTASDDQSGYSAHSPTNDLGVITPSAALSSMPYTPQESMRALKFFYYTLGDRLWGPYGFYDAFNVTEAWTADSYLAIDQGPIIIMIENYRTGLLWNLFMSAPEVQVAMDKLGFTL